MAGKLELNGDVSGNIDGKGSNIVIHGNVKAGTHIYSQGANITVDGNVGEHVTIETEKAPPANAMNGNSTTGNNSPIIMNGGDVVIGDDTPAPKNQTGSIDIKGLISHDDIIHAGRSLHVGGVIGQHNQLSADNGSVTVDGSVPAGNAISTHNGAIVTNASRGGGR